jgi:hypothetical protein
VCRALGRDTARGDGLWVNRGPSPPYYSNVVTLDARAPDQQLARIRSLLDSPLPRPWSVKDSFKTLDLERLGFEVLFEAEWIGLRPEESPSESVPDPTGPTWLPVADDAQLIAWERAWRTSNPDAGAADVGRLFQPALLADPDIRFVAGIAGGTVVGTVIANRSDDGQGPVVGMSNLVLTGKDPEASRLGAVAAVRTAFPDLPIVGYEWGDDLAAMRTLGFESLGPLRIWLTGSCHLGDRRISDDDA